MNTLRRQKEGTYVDNIFQQFKRKTGAEVSLETADDEIELFLLDVSELDAIDLLIH